MNIGPAEIIVVLAIALLVFGPKRLPEAGRSLGRTVREFRKAATAARADLGIDELTTSIKSEVDGIKTAVGVDEIKSDVGGIKTAVGVDAVKSDINGIKSSLRIDLKSTGGAKPEAAPAAPEAPASVEPPAEPAAASPEAPAAADPPLSDGAV